MMTTIRHVGLVVADLEKSLRFWCEIMGFVPLRQMEEAGPHIDAMMGLNDVKVTTVKLADTSNNLLELLHFHSHPDKPYWDGNPFSTGFTHVALTVRNLDDILHQLRLFGCSISTKPQISPDGSVKVIYASGPEGVILELVEAIKE